MGTQKNMGHLEIVLLSAWRDVKTKGKIMKNTVCTVVGTIGAFISGLFGGWIAAMTTLLIFMIIDFVSDSDSREFIK